MKELQTQRLLLRDFSMEDLDDFYAYCANPDVGIHAGWPAHQNKEQSEKVLRRMMESGEYWAVCERESGRNIGLVRLHPDERRKRSPQNVLAMSYLLAKEQWGRGYMTEALQEVLRHAFEGDWLPHDILMREKAAFSDAVGHSMVDDLKAYAEQKYTDEEFETLRRKYDFAQPFTKESLLYRELFEQYYPGQAHMIVDFWMPNKSWDGCDVDDPSARVLANYGDSGK